MEFTAIVFYDDKCQILLQIRDDKPDIRYPGLIGAFGGEVEDGETLLKSAIREVDEELGLVLVEGDLHYVTTVKILDNDDCHYYLVKFKWDINKVIQTEGAGMEFYSRDEFLKHPKIVPELRVLDSVLWDEIDRLMN
ncbi:NUDIX domain-containing protein [Candidatus Pacearchaeota archaeon]|nr:NUDIX domain-containing protein [Candidatus Pacearchaeota archaeon]